MKTGIIGRADLLEAYFAGGPELQAAVARLLGMESVAPEPVGVDTKVPVPGPDPEPPPQPTPSVVEPISVPFWRAETYARIEPPTDDGERKLAVRATPGKETADRPRPTPLAFRPLATSAAVLTKLRRVSSFSRTSGELDVPRVVDQLSRGRFPGVLPRRSRKTWGQSIHVVLDRHEHLTPYHQDQDAVLQTLRRVYPRDGVQVAELRDGATQPHRRGTPRSAAYQPPEPGTTVLVLSDLGALAVDRAQPRETWLALGKLYRESGARPIALVPCEVGCVPLEATRDWIVIPWESRIASRLAGLSPDQVEQVSRRVLTLLSYALRLEPILIREVRRLLVKGRLGAGVEARVWQDAALGGRHPEAAEFHPDDARKLQQDFEREAPDLRREVISLLERCRRDQFPAVWFLERLSLEAEATKLGLPDDDLAAAVRWAREQRNLLPEAAEKRDPTSDESLWFRRAFLRLPESPLHGSAGDTLHEIWALTSATKDRPPAGLDPARVPSFAQSLRTLELRHVGDRLVARHLDGAGGSTRPAGSLIALIRTRNGWLKLDEPDDFWDGGKPPRWAEKWGRDEFGPWVELRVETATQRLRWIPPGKFQMGSPEDDEEGFPVEVPRHEENLASGFWMFDTPCTQALWEAVTGKNPSHFKGPDRPVEKVSWDQCQAFVKSLNARCEGLELSLPSEAQWEYACRAGTVTTRYRKDLNEIAWYRENSEFQTHPVRLKAPNDWGLYDMLGNVWERCENTWTDDYTEKSRAAAAESASARRVVRGGSWYNVARFVRAAYHRTHAGRNSLLGFRCAEFRARGPVGRKQEAERTGERGGVGAEHPGDRDPVSGAGWINLDAPGMDAVAFAAVAPVRVSTDVEQIVLRAMTRPEWASAIGRDKYGLWAEFTIEGKAAPVVRQRLRWIPPGRFLMGSPEDEEGRYDGEQLPREVAIDEGFWMFDTPCTQALWEALMDENPSPSQFKSPDRPVEQVSWEDCGKFVEEISKKVGLTLALPSEAQWEYACRAGTTTSTYAGPLEIEGVNNAPILDAIAWYGGNSGHEFDLENGADASHWPEKPYPFDKAGTRRVALKKANPWGLYDMLGNVWEWCDDAWVSGDAEKSAASADRVVRGGSWGSVARGVRAASRDPYGPAYRSNALGFRCAEFRKGRDLSQQGGASKGSAAEVAEQPEIATRRAERGD